MAATSRRYPARKRSQSEDGQETWAEELLQAATACKKMIIFSGSGLSAASGMSMFSTKNGLYQRAKKKFKLQDGMKLFCYSFYKQHKADVQAFFAQIYSEAQASQAADGHYAIHTIHALGKLQRHYTMNIDGLAEVVGLDTWSKEHNPQGSTVEMHGNIRRLICPECGMTSDLTRVVINQMKAKKKIMCEKCQKNEVRFKVMLYDDDEGDCITPDYVFETLEADLQEVDLLLWVGISFEQSASVEYFRKVRHMLSQQGRLQVVKQAVINPSDEALFNVMSASCNTEDLPIMEVKATSDQTLPLLAQHLNQHLHQGTQPTSVGKDRKLRPSEGEVKEEEHDVDAHDDTLPMSIPRRKRTQLRRDHDTRGGHRLDNVSKLQRGGTMEGSREVRPSREEDGTPKGEDDLAKEEDGTPKQEDDLAKEEDGTPKGEDDLAKEEDDTPEDEDEDEDEEDDGQEDADDDDDFKSNGDSQGANEEEDDDEIDDEEEGDDDDDDDDEEGGGGSRKRRQRNAVKLSLGVRPLPAFYLGRAGPAGNRNRRSGVAAM